tara:strand:+ start:5588 stop:5989 length:402 start_codon:yes stop_codon:yes gene_type:complete
MPSLYKEKEDASRSTAAERLLAKGKRGSSGGERGTGTKVADAGLGAVQGAALGSTLGPVGTAVGAVAGGVKGWLSGSSTKETGEAVHKAKKDKLASRKDKAAETLLALKKKKTKSRNIEEELELEEEDTDGDT